MSLAKLINRPCTIHRNFTSDEHDGLGNEVTEPTEIDTFCELQEIESEESAQSVSDTRYRLYFSPGEEVGSGDEVTVPDEGRFKIEGRPTRQRNPRTRQFAQIEARACLVSAPGEEG